MLNNVFVRRTTYIFMQRGHGMDMALTWGLNARVRDDPDSHSRVNREKFTVRPGQTAKELEGIIDSKCLPNNGFVHVLLLMVWKTRSQTHGYIRGIAVCTEYMHCAVYKIHRLHLGLVL